MVYFESNSRRAIPSHNTLQKTDQRLADIVWWAKQNGVPVIVGEGYIGYTPLYATFEEGPVGKFIAEYAIRKGMDLVFVDYTIRNAVKHKRVDMA